MVHLLIQILYPVSVKNTLFIVNLHRPTTPNAFAKMNLRKSDVIQLCAAIVFILAGGMIYIMYRSRQIIFFGWLDDLGLSPLVEMSRETGAAFHPGSFVLYSLPDGLWLASYLMLINVIFGHSNKRLWLGFTLLMPVYAIGNELLQGMGLCRGHFDICDLLCYLVPFVADIIINRDKIPLPGD